MIDPEDLAYEAYSDRQAAGVAEVWEDEFWTELEPGLICMICGATWNHIGRLGRLANLDCPACGAWYPDVAPNKDDQ